MKEDCPEGELPEEVVSVFQGLAMNSVLRVF